ncbi:Homeobox protein A [Sesamum alatum]|uniref:Homeobox protein A n=1 Tax=Sesamum alatum TaxID=300844 RepID=A0AAE1XIQ4_9LAMI|nr:Homeobox protein A [Sesamum alatum]
MQTDAGSHSVVTDGNSFSLNHYDSVQDHVNPGILAPSTLGEALINFTCGQISDRVSDEFWNIQTGRDTISRDLSTGTSYFQISSIQDMEGNPLPAANFPASRYSTTEDHDKLTTSGAFPHPFECPRTVVTSTIQSMNYSHEDLPFCTSTRCDFNKFVTPPELIGRVVGRTGVQPTGNSGLNEWILMEEGNLNCNNPGSARFSNELSLSLSTYQPSVVSGISIQEQCSEMSSSGVTSYSLHKRPIGPGPEHTSSSSSNSLSLSSIPQKPLQLSPVLSGSRFFHAVQEILAEVACYALENFDQMSYSTPCIVDNGVNASFSSSCAAGRGCSTFSDGLDAGYRLDFQNHLFSEHEIETKKKHLLSLLQAVDEQYNQCLDEIHTVISAFHAVTELDPNLHARFALPTISLMYKNLKERISSHILAMGAHLSEGGEAREENSHETAFIQKQWALQQLRKKDHQLWRPQRGLPERSVSILRAWMFQNFLHPYPKDAEKHLLALKSGLTRSQVSNWFINARVRLWKPMIEEMYTEMNRRKGRGNDEEMVGIHRNQMCFEKRRFTMNPHG